MSALGFLQAIEQDAGRRQCFLVVKQGPELVRGSKQASGHDLAAAETIRLLPWQTRIVKTGVRLGLPPGFEAQVRPRSSASKMGLLVHVGTIDSDYRGEVCVIVTNLSFDSQYIEAGQRIAQLCFATVPVVELCDGNLDETERGERGFGSSGA